MWTSPSGSIQRVKDDDQNLSCDSREWWWWWMMDEVIDPIKTSLTYELDIRISWETLKAILRYRDSKTFEDSRIILVTNLSTFVCVCVGGWVRWRRRWNVSLSGWFKNGWGELRMCREIWILRVLLLLVYLEISPVLRTCWVPLFQIKKKEPNALRWRSREREREV